MRFSIQLVLAGAALASWPLTAPAKDKGDTYVYSGFVLPLYYISADSITAANDKGDDRGESPNDTPESSISWAAESALAVAVGFSYEGFGFGTSFDAEDK